MISYAKDEMLRSAVMLSDLPIQYLISDLIFDI